MLFTSSNLKAGVAALALVMACLATHTAFCHDARTSRPCRTTIAKS